MGVGGNVRLANYHVFRLWKNIGFLYEKLGKKGKLGDKIHISRERIDFIIKCIKSYNPHNNHMR